MLSSPVLVLNRLWQAVNICSLRRALCLLFVDHAEVISEENGNFKSFDFNRWKVYSEICLNGRNEKAIRTISFKVMVPEIIILRFYDMFPKNDVKFSKKNIYHRDSNTCQYCGRKLRQPQLNMDHIVPEARGGKNEWTNVVCSCKSCNSKKGHRTLEEANLKLLKEPKKPNWYPFMRLKVDSLRYESWAKFLF